MRTALSVPCLGRILAIAVLLSTTALAQESWAPLGLAGVNARCAAIAPGNSNLVMVGGDYLYISTNAGQTWATNAGVGDVWSVAFGSNANTAYAGSWGAGVFKSTDGCATWMEMNEGLANPVVRSICISPVSDNIAYAATEEGLYKTSDGGMNWFVVKEWVNASTVAVAPSNGNIVYLGTWGSGMWKSTSGGISWTKLTVGTVPDYAECFAVAVDPLDANVVYALFIWDAGWVSLDGGSTWSRVATDFEGLGAAADRLRGGFAYGVGGWEVPHRCGCYGGGAGWAPMNAGWNEEWSSRAITVDPNDSSRVYAVSPEGGLLRWTADLTPPNPPGALTANAEGKGITLNWSPSDSPDCEGYWIYRHASGALYSRAPLAAVSGPAATSFRDTGAVGGATYFYTVRAYDTAQNAGAYTNEASAQMPAISDLDVTFISRLPRDGYRYEVEMTNGVPTLVPGTEYDKRWPTVGETVTFIAHFVNKGTVPTGAIGYKWKINGADAGSGIASALQPGQEGTASFDWTWDASVTENGQSGPTITFEIDYDNKLAEVHEQNNALTDHIGAASFDIYVEPEFHEAMDRLENLAGTHSFEDWVQRQFKAMNDNLARSVYPSAPVGCLQRARIDRITVGYPEEDDLHVDETWYVGGGANYAREIAPSVDTWMIRELMRMLGLVDLTNMPVYAGMNRVTTPDNLPNGYSFAFGRPGMMGGGDTGPHASAPGEPAYMSEHEVMALNSNRGHRRGYMGEYIYDTPAQCYVLIKDSGGNPAPNVLVNVYQSDYGALPATPVMTGVTDSSGMLLLANSTPGFTVTTATGHTLGPNPFGSIDLDCGNSTLLIEMSRPGGDFDYAWLDLTQFNMAFWSGQSTTWTHTIDSRLGSSMLPRPVGLYAAGQGNQASMVWPSVTGAVSYRVYKASPCLNDPFDPEHRYENWVMRPVTTSTGTTYIDSQLGESSRYAVAAVDAQGNESPLSNRVFMPMLVEPTAIVTANDGTRVILDPLGGHPLLRQTSDGRFTECFGSAGYRLEESRYMAIDNAAGRLIISHPGDWASDRHSVRVADMDANPILEFGETGSEPGQFYYLTGVAVDAERRIYVVDNGNSRIQIFTHEGTLITAFGGHGTEPGEFIDPQGIAVDSMHRVFVCDRGNKRVQILSFDGSSVSYVGALASGFSAPMGVAVGPAGGVFVTDGDTGVVDAFNSDGVWLHSYMMPAPPYGDPLYYPTGITVEGSGRIVVCDTGNRRIATVNAAQPMDLTTARSARSGSLVYLQGKTVSAVIPPEWFYLQEKTGVPGMRVLSTQPVSVGQIVDVFGTITLSGGEREIMAETVIGYGMAQSKPAPVGIILRALGGGPFPAFDPVIPGIEGAIGLNNTGMLVRVWGKTSDLNSDFGEFYLDDGSGAKARVDAWGLTLPDDGVFVTVTGGSGAEETMSGIARVLRAVSID